MIKLTPETVSVDNILVDPNNPRFFDLEDWGQEIPPEMYANEGIQKQTLEKLTRKQLGRIEDLQNSIRTNGYIPAELIVVQPYEYSEGSFVVIEGNRRLAAIKGILGEEPLSDSDKAVQEELKEIPVLVYYPKGDKDVDEQNVMILQGIRHVSGPREWGAYQKANLVVKLHDDLRKPFDVIDKIMGLGPRITPRYYRAFKALHQMKDDEDFGRLYSPDFFTLFEEAIRKPGIRDWLGWEDETYRFTNKRNLIDFYTLLVGELDENGEVKGEPTITNPTQIRYLGDILAEGAMQQVKRITSGLLSVEAAFNQTFPPDTLALADILRDCLETLDNMKIDETRNLNSEALNLFDEIEKLIEKRRDDHKRLNS